MPSESKATRNPAHIEELCRQFLEGSGAAFEELLQAYMPLLKHLSRKYAQAGNEFEDCLAEVFIGMLHAVRTYNPQRGGLDSYIATVASHRLVDLARRTRGRHVESLDNLDQRTSSKYDPAATAPSEVPSVDSATLSPLERTCLERYIHRESVTVIAAALGCSPSSVSNALARAKRKIAVPNPESPSHDGLTRTAKHL
jgi:RNA polymerase sigma factor (sigma-70 family)